MEREMSRTRITALTAGGTLALATRAAPATAATLVDLDLLRTEHLVGHGSDRLLVLSEP